MTQRPGFTLVELLVVMAIIALLISVLMPALARARANAKKLQDLTQVKEVHKALISWGMELGDHMPIPGLLQRQKDQMLGAYVPGRGAENAGYNDHGSLHAAAIMHNCYKPDLIISPVEPSPIVSVYDEYDMSAYAPAGSDGPGFEGVYWDPTLEANLEGDGSGFGNQCHVSYAMMPLAGERRINHWDRLSGESSFPMMGTRGAREGDISLLDPQNAHQTTTVQFHGMPEQYVGVFVFGDNHTETFETFYPEMVQYQQIDLSNGDRATVPDNIFQADAPPQNPAPFDSSHVKFGHDAYLTVVDLIQYTSGDPVYEVEYQSLWD